MYTTIPLPLLLSQSGTTGDNTNGKPLIMYEKPKSTHNNEIGCKFFLIYLKNPFQ